MSVHCTVMGMYLGRPDGVVHQGVAVEAAEAVHGVVVGVHGAGAPSAQLPILV